MKLLILMAVIAISLINLVYADGIGNCAFGNYEFGNCAVSSGSSSSSGSGASQVNIPLSLSVNPFGVDPTNQSCASSMQLLEGRCYPCNPETGYLQFNPSDRSVACVSCAEGYYLNNNQCKLKSPSLVKNVLNQQIDDYAGKISSLIGTQNLMVGYFVLAFGFVISVSYLLGILTKKK